MCIEEQGQLVEPYELQMLESRIIPGLLQMQTVISEGKRRYLYDISGKQQIGDFYSGKKIGYEMLQLFLLTVWKVCNGLSEFLLREGGICLELEFIYVNLEDGSLQFTYLPFCEQNLPEAFEKCMEQLLRKLDHQDKAAVELGYQAYQLCVGGNANIGKLLETVLGKPLLSEKRELPGRTVGGEWESAAGGNKEKTKEKEGRTTEQIRGMERRDRKDERKSGKYKGKETEKAIEISDIGNLEGEKKAWQGKLEKGKMQAAEAVKKYLPGFSGKLAWAFEKVRENWNQKSKKHPQFLVSC